MTFREMKKKIEKTIKENKKDFEYIGLRFENKEREIGGICENSKHNPDRDDDRDFPEHGSEEYNNLPEFNGASAWDLSKDVNIYVEPNYADWKDKIDGWFIGEHCYIIVGNNTDNDLDRDYDEIIIKNAKVVKQIF